MGNAEIVASKKAWTNHKAIEKCMTIGKLMGIRVGKLLFAARENSELWQGFSTSFEAYCREWDLAPRQTQKLIGVHKFYERELKIDEMELAPIGVEKLDLLREVVKTKEDALARFHDAREMSLRELEVEIEKELAKAEARKPKSKVDTELMHYWSMTPDQRQEFHFQINARNAERVRTDA